MFGMHGRIVSLVPTSHDLAGAVHEVVRSSGSLTSRGTSPHRDAELHSQD